MGSKLLVTNGAVLQGRHFEETSVLVNRGKIEALTADIEPEAGWKVVDAKDCLVVPGFVDLHVHGAAGVDFSETGADGNRAALYHAAHGTTGFLATTMTASRDMLENIVRGLAAKVGREEAGARMLGIHLEGPFISPAKAGAHDRDQCREPDLGEMAKLIDLSGGSIRLVTLAPELQGAPELVSCLVKHKIRASMGHSDASYLQAAEAFACGLAYCTHGFNALRSLHHRDPGGMLAVLLNDRIYLELICDGLHLAPEVIKLVTRLKPADKIILVTDCTAAGCPPGKYHLGGREVFLEDGMVRTPEGALAGSVLTMDLAIKNMMAFSGLSLEEVLPMATSNPARVLGSAAGKGSIEPGKDADLVLLEHRSLEVVATIIEGRVIVPSTP